MLIGHKLLVNNFKALVKSERLAHGYLFFGPEGVGKKTFALALANFLETENFDSDSGKILNDVLLIQPDEKGTIGIDAVRGIKNFLCQRPNASLRRTLIVDEVEALTGEAQNALLKITEEPPESSFLILVARDPEILMPTLQSRLQKIYFAPLRFNEVEEGLKNRIKNYESRIMKEVVKESRGSLGLALKMSGGDLAANPEISNEAVKFQETRKLAEKFLTTSGGARKDFIKELLERSPAGGDFDILAFLDAAVLVLADRLRNYENVQNYEKNAELWHKVLKLRQNFSNFPLNPKLQLLNLL